MIAELGKARLEVIVADITTLDVDAIVNAANTSLLVELRAIEFVNRMIEEGRLPHGTAAGEYRKIRVHRIVLEGLGERMSSSSKVRNDFESFELLRKLGQRAARHFLKTHYAAIGERSSAEVKSEIFAAAR